MSFRRTASILQMFKAKFNHQWVTHFSLLHANFIIRKRDLPGTRSTTSLLALLTLAGVQERSAFIKY